MSLFRTFMGMRGSNQSFIVPGLGQGRAALQVIPTSLDLEGLGGGRRPPGSSGKSLLIAPAQPALLNRSLLFLHRYLKTGIQQGEVQKKISISLNSDKSSRINTHHRFAYDLRLPPGLEISEALH